MEMPEVFLRATGGWKGNAVELYRKDRLPKVQGQFAQLLQARAKQDLKNSVYSTDPHPRPARPIRGRRGSIRAAITPRRLPLRISGEPVCARRDSEIDSEFARPRGTSPSPGRIAPYEVLSGKCRSGQSIVMPRGGGWVGNGMTF